ncbi:MAG: hypothetical protein ACRDAI_08140 [Candidatus Rhabdochlamydia sp.]
MYTPISSSEKLGCKIQYKIFDFLDKKTEYVQWLRPPAFLALGASITTHLVAKTASSVELTFRGIQLVYSSMPHSENKQRGWSMLKKAPCELIECIGFPIVFLWFGFFIIKVPKYYILNSSERLKVELRHMEAGTTNTEEYDYDLYDVNSTVHDRLMEWQKRNKGLRASQASLNNESDISLAND